jgi:hypothetical protein
VDSKYHHKYPFKREAVETYGTEGNEYINMTSEAERLKQCTHNPGMLGATRVEERQGRDSVLEVAF